MKATGQVILYRTDLIVVGNGASGKITLVHRMKWDDFRSGTTMTDGINITHLRIGQVLFDVRDTAGQLIYAHTISLFFKEEAIYLAVFNPRVENNLDALTQFLHMVQNSSPQARVVLATTRSDEARMDEIMLADLYDRFPIIICDAFPLDSLSGHGVDNLRQCLVNEALSRPSARQVVSAALPKMIDRIVRYAEEHQETFYVSRKQLLSITGMGGSDVTAEEQTRLLDQLVSFGTIRQLSPSGSSGGDPLFILRPQQLADVLACVVTRNPETLARTGRLGKEGILDHSDDALRSVWGKYPEALWSCEHAKDGITYNEDSVGRLSLFVRVLYDSGLAYEVFDRFGRPQGRSVVPCILPNKSPGFVGDIKDDFELLSNFVPGHVISTSLLLEKLQVSFSAMPFTFFAQLLAGLRKMATDGGAWRHGAVLSAGVSFALLREERSGISISLLGKNRSVRSVILLTMLDVMQKFSSMQKIKPRVVFTVAGREWSGDDIEEALHDGHGVLHSSKIIPKVELHSLWMLFPQVIKEDECNAYPNLSQEKGPANFSDQMLNNLQWIVQRAKTAMSVDFDVLINHHLQSSVPALLQLMGAPRPSGGDSKSRPLWVVLKRHSDGTFCAMPFFQHYVPDEPWMALETAMIPFTPALPSADSDASELAAISKLLSDCFSAMRGNVQDMLPSGWELALIQSLVGVDPDLIEQRETSDFVCVDGAVFSKEFAAKAQAMKTVSLGKKSSKQMESVSEPVSDGISVAALRSLYEECVKEGKITANCTTGDMLALVKSLTKTAATGSVGLSYCQLLIRQQTGTSSEVGPATVFISHAWKYYFCDFLMALEMKFKDQADVRLWIDLFCHNQHEDLTSDDWITKFEEHIVRIHNTVMIVFPWKEPIPFTRAWCILEVFYTTKNAKIVNFEVVLTEEQRAEFKLASICEAMLNFSRISTRHSTCWVRNDQRRIHSLIESSVGFDTIDHKVREAIAAALEVEHPDGNQSQKPGSTVQSDAAESKAKSDV